MIVQTTAWENTLLAWAHEARRSTTTTAPRRAFKRDVLERAYAHCAAMTAAHSRSFYAATRFLPASKRQAIRALYAFCRVTDNIVDSQGTTESSKSAFLAAWRRTALSSEPPADDRVAVAWADTRLRWRIPQRYVEQLIDGVSRDLRPARYATFEELTAYAYGVASTVGLMSMHIIGFAGVGAIPYAIRLGVALQLTNILRDVGEDWRAGRVYLPQDELAAYGLSEADLAAGRVDDRWRAFMRFQIERNRDLYRQARPGIALLNADGRLAVAAAAELYAAILDDIEAHDYDVFTRRAHVGAIGKVRRLIGLRLRGLARV
jgi:phytoene synthase